MDKKYLPSEQVIARVIIITVIIAVVFGMYKLVNFIKNKINEKGSGAPVQIVIGDLIQKDTNDNGIADWEEYLWGLDPEKNGKSNKEFILAKKNALVQSGEINPEDGSLVTDSDMLSREFFMTIISLQQTGNLDEESMKSVSEAMGKNIEADPIPDIYTSNMLITKDDSNVANEEYHNELSKLIVKYTNADIGSELTFLVQGLSNNDPDALYAAKTVGDAYISFGEEMMKISVPKSLSYLHLSAANNYQKVGQSIIELTQILSDQLVGMKAIINYKNYSDSLASNLEKISEILQ